MINFIHWTEYHIFVEFAAENFKKWQFVLQIIQNVTGNPIRMLYKNYKINIQAEYTNVQCFEWKILISGYYWYKVGYQAKTITGFLKVVSTQDFKTKNRKHKINLCEIKKNGD